MPNTIYGTLEGALAYHTARNNDAWLNAPDSPDSPDDYRYAALMRGSDYIDAVYGSRYPGSRTDGRAQDRPWPRKNATDQEGNEIADDEVPVEIEQATYEAALRELESPGSLLPDYIAAERVRRERVEGAVEIEYSDKFQGAAGAIPVVSLIDGILEPLLGKKTKTGAYFIDRA